MDLTEFLKGQMQQSLSPALIEQMAGQLGENVAPQQAQQAASSAVSVLLNALARNAATPAGAESLNNALEKDNHGSLLDGLLGGLTGGGQSAPAGGMDLGGLIGGLMGGGSKSGSAGGMDMGGLLGGLVTGMLGGNNNRAANGAGILKHILGRRTEDTAAQIGQQSGLSTESTMKMMAMLAPIVMGMLGKTKQQGNLNADGLGGLLDGFLRTNVNPQKPAAQTNIGLATQFLDRDGDGSAIDDIAGMLGGFLSRK